MGEGEVSALVKVVETTRVAVEDVARHDEGYSDSEVKLGSFADRILRRCGRLTDLGSAGLAAASGQPFA